MGTPCACMRETAMAAMAAETHRSPVESDWKADGLNAQPERSERFYGDEPTASGQPALPLRSAFMTVSCNNG